ncbi:hypothetical protein [Caulobacter sp. S45]|uniref:hypothetical protein n=1 Tax=Caulobacter sp. S45 TaxID=1641861 RepID=UPI001C2090C1|nr:hypothetical protein [Caulobacter sp. S45]
MQVRTLCVALGLMAASALPVPVSAGTTNYFYDAQGRVTGATSTTASQVGAYFSDNADNRNALSHASLPAPAALYLMNAGQGLLRNQTMWSQDGRYELVLQGDGNLVLYGPSGALWSSATSGTQAAYLVMQGDGNLVLYDVQSKALWSSQTSGNAGAYLALQTDGNLVVYSASNAAVWNTGT